MWKVRTDKPTFQVQLQMDIITEVPQRIHKIISTKKTLQASQAPHQSRVLKTYLYSTVPSNSAAVVAACLVTGIDSHLVAHSSYSLGEDPVGSDNLWEDPVSSDSLWEDPVGSDSFWVSSDSQEEEEEDPVSSDSQEEDPVSSDSSGEGLESSDSSGEGLGGSESSGEGLVHCLAIRNQGGP